MIKVKREGLQCYYSTVEPWYDRHTLPAMPLMVDLYPDCIVIQRKHAKTGKELDQAKMSVFNGRTGTGEIAQ